MRRAYVLSAGGPAPGGITLRAIKADGHTGIEFSEDLFRAGRQGMGFVCGDVETQLYLAGHDVNSQHHDKHRRHAAGRIKNGFEVFPLPQAVYRGLMAAKDHTVGEEGETDN
jgi:hypothetical protein